LFSLDFIVFKMRKTVWVLSLIIMLLSQVMTPFTYAVSWEVVEGVAENTTVNEKVMDEDWGGAIIEEEFPVVDKNIIEVVPASDVWNHEKFEGGGY